MKETIFYYLKTYKWLCIIVSSIVLILFSSILVMTTVYNRQETTQLLQTNVVQTAFESSQTSVESKVVVDVKGEVIKPGVYTLSVGSRVVDVIEKAGGFTQNANKNQINLAQFLTDEMVIIVSKVGDEQSNVGHIDKDSGKININTATKSQLMTLDGIGESKADAIIAQRSQQKFTTVDDLQKVKGISKKIIDNIKNDVIVK